MKERHHQTSKRINMAEKDLQANLDFVQANNDELIKNYLNKFILVYNNGVVGSFDTYEAAAQEGIRLFGLKGNFLVNQITSLEPVNFVMAALL